MDSISRLSALLAAKGLFRTERSPQLIPVGETLFCEQPEPYPGLAPQIR